MIAGLSVVLFGLGFWLIARCSMTRVAPFGLLQTVFAVAAGVIVLHEPLTATLVSGAAICIAGVAVTQIRSFTWRISPVAASVSAGGPIT